MISLRENFVLENKRKKNSSKIARIKRNNYPAIERIIKNITPIHILKLKKK
jgi:hypothetical protein